MQFGCVKAISSSEYHEHMSHQPVILRSQADTSFLDASSCNGHVVVKWLRRFQIPLQRLLHPGAHICGEAESSQLQTTAHESLSFVDVDIAANGTPKNEPLFKQDMFYKLFLKLDISITQTSSVPFHPKHPNKKLTRKAARRSPSGLLAGSLNVAACTPATIGGGPLMGVPKGPRAGGE